MPLTQATVLHSSNTFEFMSKHPRLHEPPHAVASADYTDPNSADLLVDGEWIWLDSNGKVNKITAADLPGGGAAKPMTFFKQVHGQPGRTDLQYGVIPVVDDENYIMRTRLVDTGGAWSPGVKAKVGLIAFPKADTAGLVVAGAGEEYVAELQRIENDGWYVFMVRKGRNV